MPGLAAKPIVDPDIVVASNPDVRSVIERLATIGYRWRGDLGVTGREAFTAVHGQGLPPHQLYVVVEDKRRRFATADVNSRASARAPR